MAAKIKKGDKVVVISGKYKGTKGEVVRAIPTEDRVVVSGVNIKVKHQKATQADPQGGIKRIEAPIHVSNVAHVDPSDGKALVSGVNLVKRHQKQSQTQEGGIISKEAFIQLSNIAIADPKDGKPTRVGFKILDDGRKVRVAKRSGDLIDG